eukprot:scaffold397782_cov18-Prasinocladus_malaysianus.AAC.1
MRSAVGSRHELERPKEHDQFPQRISSSSRYSYEYLNSGVLVQLESRQAVKGRADMGYIDIWLWLRSSYQYE